MTIHGGAGGVRAHCEDLDQLASRTEDLGGGLALVALRGHQMLVDLRLLLAAPLDPLGWALFEAELLEALD
jgi:hypothetical protein